MSHQTVSRIVRFLILIFIGSNFSYVKSQVTVPSDTIKNVAKDSTLATSDTLKTDSNTTETVNLEAMKANSDLKAKISYNATDYMVLDMDAKTLKLVSQGKIDYEEMNLAADTIIMNWESNVLTAKGKLDSTGQLVGRPEFEEDGQKYRSDSMQYNITSQKGLVFGARTQQDENYILAERVKKGDGDTYYIENGKFTTCDAEHPHYYIKSRKLKVIPRDKIITGPLMLVIEDFPIPVILPFGLLPNQTTQKSGILMPQYGESDRGFFLRDGGYYIAASDKFDLAFTGDIFSKGSWRLNAATNYNVLYKYDGRFSFDYALFKNGDETDPDPSITRDFKVNWNHNQKINPQTTLRANVNAGTSSYNQNANFNQNDYVAANLASSINLDKNFPNSRWRTTLRTALDQNTQTEKVTFNFPELTVNRPRLFPFKQLGKPGDQWYKKVGLSYQFNLRNSISVIDSLFDDVVLAPLDFVTLSTVNGEDTLIETKRALDFYQNGAEHFIPLTGQLNLAKYINVSPRANFRESWYIKTVDKTYIDSTQSVVTTDKYGFAATRAFDLGIDASTRVFGVFQFKGKKQTAIRHTFSPTIGYTYKPDFSEERWNVFREVQTDSLGTTRPYSRFEGNSFAGPSAGESQSVSLRLGNVLEMKYKDPKLAKDTTAKDDYTRLKLLDSFGARGSYNFAADSLNLSFINLDARTSIFDNALAIQWTGIVDPYIVNADGNRINTFALEEYGKLGRLSTMTLALSTRLQSKRRAGNRGGGVTDEGEAKQERRPANMTDQAWSDVQYMRAAFIDFDIPWSLNLNYNLRYSNNGIRRDTTMTVNFSGDFNFTPKWKIGFNSGWDFSNKEFSPTSVTFFRDLHCWEFSGTWVPFGLRRSYQFSIGVRSSTLSDLKLSQQRNWQDRF